MSFRRVSKLLLFFFASCCLCAHGLSGVKKAAIVIDYTNNKRVVFAENSEVRCYPASLTKLMTAYIFLEEFEAGRISSHTKFKTSTFAARQIRSKLDLKIGEKVQAIKLLEAICVKSANDAAVVIAEGIAGSVTAFVKRMNNTARKLGMHNTHFENPSGVPNTNQYTTARDIATLSICLYKRFNKYWHFFSQKSCEHNGTKHHTHAKILRWYKGADGAKTGFINASGFNLFVTAQKYNKNGQPKRVFVVVFGRDSSRIRDLYAAKLMDKYLADHTKIVTTSEGVPPVPVPVVSKKKKKHSPFEDMVITPEKKEIPSVPKDEIDTTEVIEFIDEEEITFEQIKGYSEEEKDFIEELYINDDETLEFVEDEEEVIIKAKSHVKRIHNAPKRAQSKKERK